ncbi:MAG: formate dehydrogenase subunit gamma [Betaproteobacteria bacterium]|nr:formate dehydrogenase subunit gamma [Betaproteobacteria bacterium]
MTGWLVLALAFALPAGAQQQPAADPDPIKTQQRRAIEQPGNNAPVWRNVQSGQPNYASIPGREAGVLIQPQARFPGQDAIATAGEAWRKFRNGPVTVYGGWLIVVVCAIIAGIYFVQGPIKVHEQPTGRLLPRFSVAERWAHWVMGISFCVLGATGLIMLFGKHVLLPVFGYTLFAWLSSLAKNLHNFVAPLFVVSLVVFILMYLKDNLPEKGDGAWLATSWRMFTGGKQPASGRFNGGEKVWYWVGVVAMCLVVSASGLVLLFPNFEQLRTTMQQMHIIHVVSAVLVTGFALAHIYMGTIGVEGAYGNMRDGVTDEAWAKEHHANWYQDVKSGKEAAKSGAAPQTQH